MPCLGRRDWVIEQMAALRSQTYPHDRYEVIVVDNGSKDGTWEFFIEEAKRPGPPLRYFRNHTGHPTCNGSRQVGVDNARGTVLAFTDTDCLVTPEWLINGVRRAMEEGVGLVVGRTLPPPQDPVNSLSRVRRVEEIGFYDSCNIFYRREAFMKVGGFDLMDTDSNVMFLGDDTDLGCRVVSAGYRELYAPEALLYHRVRQMTLKQWLFGTQDLFGVAYFVRRNPVIRKLFFLRYFMSAHTFLFDLGVAGTLAAFWHPAFLLLWLPYLAPRLAKWEPPHRKLLRIGAAMFRGTVTFGVLIYSSVRFRALVI